MIENVPLSFPEEKIIDVRKRLLGRAKEFEILNYIYVIDKKKTGGHSFYNEKRTSFQSFANSFYDRLGGSSDCCFLCWFFSRIKYDPALVSGPFATVIRDIMSLLIYFSIAQLILKIFG